MSTCCITGEALALPGQPRGEDIVISGLKTYYVEGKDSQGKALVILTDVFCLVHNPRIIADILSDKSGFSVFVPDLSLDYPIDLSLTGKMPEQAGQKMSWGQQLTFYQTFLTTLLPWLFAHRQSKVLPVLEPWMKSLRSDRSVKRIGTIGYCYGGQLSLHFGGKAHLADVVMGCHISMSSLQQYKDIKVPLGIALAEEDDQMPPKFVAKVRQVMKEKATAFETLQTDKTFHGYAARPNLDIPEIKKAFEQTNDFLAGFAKAHL